MEHWRAWHKAACALPLPAGRRLAAYGSFLALLLATVGVHSVHSAFDHHNDHCLARSSVLHQRSAQRSTIKAWAELAGQWCCPICTFLADYRADADIWQSDTEWGHRLVVVAPHEEPVVTVTAERASLGIRAPPVFMQIAVMFLYQPNDVFEGARHSARADVIWESPFRGVLAKELHYG